MSRRIDPATGKVVYARNADRFFVPGSTTKLITVGAMLAVLGPDHRFHTRVYRTGEVDASGTLHGDIVLVAAGDPNLPNRSPIVVCDNVIDLLLRHAARRELRAGDVGGNSPSGFLEVSRGR